jgi:murein DD-endopeptidase MepM/ murein hydrolase activator NlpD
MLPLLKNWWLRLAAALLVAFSVMGWVVSQTPHRPTPQAISAQAEVSDDTLLTAETGFSPQEIQAMFEKRASPLAGYSETVGEQALSAAELFWVTAQHADYGLSPKALLTTLYVEDGWNWTQSGGLYAHLKQMALELERGYQQGLSAAPAAGAKSAGQPASSAASLALAQYYASNAKTIPAGRGSPQAWSTAYRQLFNQDPARADSAKAPATQVPFLGLPFKDPAGSFVPVEAFFDHSYPGQIEERSMLRADGKALPGAHYSGCWSATTCYSGHNATDFTLPSGTPIYAAAAGKVVERIDSEGGLLIDHGNGYRTIYWHMDKVIVNWNQQVKDGEQIGWSDCRGTCSHPHLHFGLRLTALSADVDPFGWWSTSADPGPAPSKFMWRGDLLADNGEPQTRLFYNQDWARDSKGYGGESWYTSSSTQAANATNWGMWGTNIPTAGKYKVSAYWPKNAANTTAAVYQVWHAGGMSPVKVNQRSDGDRFVSLGTFDFNAGPVVVILTDLTPNAAQGQRVYFDAVKWEPASLQYYLPIAGSK